MSKQPKLDLTYLSPIKTRFRDQTPFSEHFDDVYYSAQGGLEESRYVFIEHNDLLNRWQQCHSTASFCIAETGFGTGLNFLATCQAWQASNHRPKRLHFISFEKFPLDASALKQAHSTFPELSDWSQSLLKQYGRFRSGLQMMKFDQGITLMLYLGDANDAIRQLNASVDAWYLDGFAPSKNPDMWQPDLFHHINRLSHPGTTLATFTAASVIRKQLQANGFEVTKQPGFGRKREMITATFDQPLDRPPANHPWNPQPKATNKQPQVTLLGGGIAGMCLSYHLKAAGLRTHLVDQHASPMQEASGNAYAMMMPMLTAQASPESLFYVRAFEYASAFYQDYEFNPIGVRQELLTPKQQAWGRQLRQMDLPSDWVQCHDSHVLYPQAGYIDTQQLAQRLQSSVDQWLCETVFRISRSDDGQWQLHDTNDEVFHQTEVLILANGMRTAALLSGHDWFLTAKHGQTTTIQTDNSLPVDQVLMHEGYLIPTPNQQQWLCGATFDHVDPNQQHVPAQLHADHWERNLALWAEHPLHSALANAEVIQGHAAIRATTPDHLPLCGPVINQSQFTADYQDLHHGRHWQNYPAAACHDNLYVLNGLGSRGYTSAPILAQHLMAMILAEPLPLEADLCKIIHPNRFLYRQLKKPPNQR